MTNNELLERFRELEARLQRVNVELEGLRVAIKGRTFTEKKAETPTKVYEVGEYVRVKPYEYSDEFVGMITDRNETPKGFFYLIYGKDKAAINMDVDMLEEWQPKKGEMCIFWDSGFEDTSVIGVFRKKIESHYYYNTIAGWDNCIPFISAEQFKEHIGYEN